MNMQKEFTVFIIDDDADDRELFCDIIRAYYPKIECNTACDGIDALALLRGSTHQKPNLILLDMNMHKINGSDFLHQIKKDPLLAEIPVVMCSSSEPRNPHTYEPFIIKFIVKPSRYIGLQLALKGIIDPLLKCRTQSAI